MSKALYFEHPRSTPRLAADTLKETWKVRVMLTPEEVRKIAKVDANLLKGAFTYERVREPSHTR